MKKLVFGIFASLLLASGFVSTASAYDIQKVGGKIQISVDPRELFAPTTEKIVDVLFVVDNSGSMDKFQKDLATHVQHFAQELKDFNIHAGVLTTDVENSHSKPGIINWVDSKDPNWNEQLKKNLIVGTMGSATERPLDSIASSISQPQYSQNANFFRANSNLVIVILTDAEDQSQISIETLTQQLTAIKPGRAISIHGLIVPSSLDDATREACSTENTPAPRIEWLIKQFNGVVASLCSPASLQSGVQDIVKDINNKVRAVGAGGYFTLPLVPEVSSINVVYGKTLIGGDVDYGWVYHKRPNQLQFGTYLDWNSEPIGTELVITYVPTEWKQ